MKALTIEFIPSTRWRVFWVVTLASCAVIGAAAAVQWMNVQKDVDAEAQTVAYLEEQIKKLRTPPAPSSDPKQADALKAAQYMQQDLNLVFAAAENLKISGVRLTAITFDTSGDTLKLDYALQTLEQAAQVTELLNSGYDSKPWHLGNVVTDATSSRSMANTPASMPPLTRNGPVVGVVKATWSVKLRALMS
jgi:hypothetical protein